MKSKKGISLIVLVITIIIMIILASSTIISLSNSNIINEANKAVELTNLNQVEHIASLAWSEAYMDGKISQGQLKIAVDKALEDNKVDITKYNIEVTVNGVEVKLASETPTIKLDNTIASFNVALGGYQTSARYYEGEGKYPIGIVGGSDKASANGGIKEINFYSKKSGETDDKYVPTTVSVYPDTIESTSIDGFCLLLRLLHIFCLQD